MALFARHNNENRELNAKVVDAVIGWAKQACVPIWLCSCAMMTIDLPGTRSLAQCRNQTYGYRCTKSLRVLSHAKACASVGRLHPAVLSYLESVSTVAIPLFLSTISSRDTRIVRDRRLVMSGLLKPPSPNLITTTSRQSLVLRPKSIRQRRTSVFGASDSRLFS